LPEETLKQIQVICHDIMHGPLPSLHPDDVTNLHALLLYDRAKYENVGERNVANKILSIMGYPSRIRGDENGTD
jgi:hypothetical protein